MDNPRRSAAHVPFGRLTRREALLGATAALIGASIPSAAAASKTIRAVMHAPLRLIDPITSTAYISRDHGYMIYDTLVAADENFQPRPQMADWTISDDKLTYTFKLRDGLAWHDGAPVTAEDCVASLKRWWQRDTMGQLLASYTASLEASDPRTIVLKLKQPGAAGGGAVVDRRFDAGGELAVSLKVDWLPSFQDMLFKNRPEGVVVDTPNQFRPFRWSSSRRCGGPGPPQPHRDAAAGRRVVVIIIELAQRGENVREPDRLIHAGNLAQRRMGFDRVHVRGPGRQYDPLLRCRELAVVEDGAWRCIMRSGMEQRAETAGGRIGIGHHSSPSTLLSKGWSDRRMAIRSPSARVVAVERVRPA
ncbi:hypothetical protein GGD64_004610 [Bradyrhizobium sp. CIR3A]|nr:hypothetical protein [Bradyrhizobium sp. CIR3A]NYG46841.1 hypothetical protein [Bradyrhizobium sp. IAR9]